MIERYQSRDIAKIFSAETRAKLWLQIETQAALGCADCGLIPVQHAQTLEQKLSALDTVAIAQRAADLEVTLKHDVIAFMTACEEQLGDEAASLHYGLTSSDVVDSAFAAQLRDACDVVERALVELVKALRARAEEHKLTHMPGRSHGMHAEPTTFGIVLLSHATEFGRQITRLQNARSEIAVGKLSGAVGTFTHLPASIEERVMSALGLHAEAVATQVVPRDRHAALFAALANIGGSIERFSTNMRHWQRSELREVEEPFTPGQRGSSAMPHKRNPIGSENLCGIARLLRGYAQAAFEDVALWHERDISHSSVERVIGPDAFHITHYALQRLTKIVSGMQVYPESMQRNLARSCSLHTSQAVLLALARSGVARHDAYATVQRYAMQAWREQRDFMELVASAPEFAGVSLGTIDVTISAAQANVLFARADAELKHVVADLN